MRTAQKALFYLSSFIPLYGLLIIQNLDIKNDSGNYSFKTIVNQIWPLKNPSNYFWFVLIILIVISLIGCFLFFGVYTKKDGVKATLEDAEFVREDTMGYIVSYIVPLISIDINNTRSLFVNLFLFIIIGTFYVKNDQIFMNPLYNVFGYNIFSTEKGIYLTKISKHRLKIIAKRNLDIYKINILGDIYVLKELKKVEK